MALRDILVFLDQFDHSAVRLEAAVDLAARHGARLIGLRAEVHPHLPNAIRSDVVDAALSAHDDAIRADTLALEVAFRERASAARVDCDWWVVRDGGVAKVCELARYANITVVGQPAADAEEEFSGADLLHDLVLSSGRPVLVVPRAALAGSLGHRIAIAWNGSGEASRALADAMPLLRKADQVAILLAKSADSAHVLAMLVNHLKRNGVAAEARGIDASAYDHDAGTALLAEADAFAADLLVMGAYGRSRIRELVLGGATRHILRHLPIPTLMSH